MSHPSNPSVLDALLDSWDRNNQILVNLLRAIPQDTWDLKPIENSPSIAALFVHMHYVRLVFVQENAPEFAQDMPKHEWMTVRDRDRLAQMLDESAKAVRDAVTSRLHSGKPMAVHYDHPILMFQHLVWHEGYHHGQIKLTLKLAGRPMDDEEIGRVTWDLWMDKTATQ
jgi:uncharacterized damage-inducible protein DinB